METPTPVPAGQKLFPHLILRDVAAAISFYERAFGARELYRLDTGGKIGHAEIEFAGVTIWLADEYPELGLVGPAESTPVMLVLYVEDVDLLATRAVAAGAKLERPVKDEFYGDRVAVMRDPFGHRWSLHARREIVSPDEMRERMMRT